MTSYRTIRYALADKVATITLDRPHRMNALTPMLFQEATAAIDQALHEQARVVVLTGEGKSFCSGADLVGDDSGASPPDDLGEMLRAYYNPFVLKIAELPIPLICAVNGVAAGAGLALALLGDIIVAARSAYATLAFVHIGLVPDAGSTWLVAKAVGRAKALELALLGEKISAEEAVAAGLFTRVVDDERLEEEIGRIARKLADGPAIAIGMIRQQVAAALTATLPQTLDIETANQTRAGRTTDFREAVAAFAAKRSPRFEGR